VIYCRHPQLLCARNARLPGNICTADSERYIIEKTHALAIAINSELDLQTMERVPKKLTGLMVERRVWKTLMKKLGERNNELLLAGGGGLPASTERNGD
jgi:hypothetical protein